MRAIRRQQEGREMKMNSPAVLWMWQPGWAGIPSPRSTQGHRDGTGHAALSCTHLRTALLAGSARCKTSNPEHAQSLISNGLMLHLSRRWPTSNPFPNFKSNPKSLIGIRKTQPPSKQHGFFFFFSPLSFLF